MADRVWWRDGVVYQIYPRSFMDSNGDGVGDLEGIRSRLDHLAWLGVDALWLSPCFPSPMKDFGYDVSDYCDVDPMFGSLASIDTLIEEAHALDLKVILDWVPNHTSDQHAWFLESRASRESPKRDWYVWRDPAPGGGPPNNWLSIFGGPAWEWDEATGQYYLHSFLVEQPELDWRNPEVEAAMHDVLRFWFDRGVDGFRIDVIHRIAKHPELLDNPSAENGLPGFLGQKHLHDEDHPDIHGFLKRIRRVVDAYPSRMTVGEVALVNPEPSAVASYYGQDDELNLAFNFHFFHQPWSASGMRKAIDDFVGELPQGGWPCWVLSNHDFSRHATRFDHPELGDARARIAAALLLTLRGTPFLYYGEEIGMRDVPIPEDRFQDPLAWTIHPKLTRDPERTPMQWDNGPGAGFTTAEPWLPLAEDFGRRNVEAQRWDESSLLHLYRDLLALRRATPALERGGQRWLPAPAEVLAFERRTQGSRALVALNLGSEPARVELPEGRVRGGLHTSGARVPSRAQALELGPCQGIVLVVD